MSLPSELIDSVLDDLLINVRTMHSILFNAGCELVEPRRNAEAKLLEQLISSFKFNE